MKLERTEETKKKVDFLPAFKGFVSLCVCASLTQNDEKDDETRPEEKKRHRKVKRVCTDRVTGRSFVGVCPCVCEYWTTEYLSFYPCRRVVHAG